MDLSLFSCPTMYSSWSPASPHLHAASTLGCPLSIYSTQRDFQGSDSPYSLGWALYKDTKEYIIQILKRDQTKTQQSSDTVGWFTKVSSKWPSQNEDEYPFQGSQMTYFYYYILFLICIIPLLPTPLEHPLYASPPYDRLQLETR